jgi:hypothetical protein
MLAIAAAHFEGLYRVMGGDGVAAPTSNLQWSRFWVKNQNATANRRASSNGNETRFIVCIH